MLTNEDINLINQYIARLEYYKESALCSAIVHFLSKRLGTEENVKRREFLLKVLKECTYSGQLHIDLFPMEVEKKLIEAYKEDKKKEEDEKQAHIAELMEEMNEIF